MSRRSTGIQDEAVSRSFKRVCFLLQALLPHLLPQGINVMAFDFVGSGMSDVCVLILTQNLNLLHVL